MTPAPHITRRLYVIYWIVIVQAVAAGFVLIYYVFWVQPDKGLIDSDDFRNAVQTAFVIVMTLSVIHGILALRQMRSQLGTVKSQLRVASGSFQNLIDEEFGEWGLTPAEYDVALFILKGMSNAEIAEITAKKIGTIKAHSNAVFRKSGLANRNQLASYFLEVLLQEPLLGEEEQEKLHR